MKYIASPFIAFISLFGIHTASGQLAVISDQNINFSNAVSTISDGDFFIESSFESEVETSIYSLNGKLLKTIKHNTKTPISTKDLTIGTYAISVRTNEIALTKLLIINK
jgi:hypothetical protein